MTEFTERDLKIQARLFALEHLMQNLIATVYLVANVDRETIEWAHGASQEGLRNETLPGADPVQADMWLSELEEAVTQIQRHALETWAEKRRKAGLPD